VVLDQVTREVVLRLLQAGRHELVGVAPERSNVLGYLDLLGAGGAAVGQHDSTVTPRFELLDVGLGKADEGEPGDGRQREAQMLVDVRRSHRHHLVDPRSGPVAHARLEGPDPPRPHRVGDPPAHHRVAGGIGVGEVRAEPDLTLVEDALSLGTDRCHRHVRGRVGEPLGIGEDGLHVVVARDHVALQVTGPEDRRLLHGRAGGVRVLHERRVEHVQVVTHRALAGHRVLPRPACLHSG
jgi:hypothetical protein